MQQRRYLVDVITVDFSAAIYRVDVSRKPGAAAAKAERRKTREYESKVDGKTTPLFPATLEMSGRWGEGLVSPFYFPRNFPNIILLMIWKWRSA